MSTRPGTVRARVEVIPSGDRYRVVVEQYRKRYGGDPYDDSSSDGFAWRPFYNGGMHPVHMSVHRSLKAAIRRRHRILAKVELEEYGDLARERRNAEWEVLVP